MEKEKTIQTLKARLEKEKAAYENQIREEEKYKYLPRKRYFSANRKLGTTIRRIAALKTAIELLEKPFREVDLHEGCMMGLPPSRHDWQETLDKADSPYLRERAEAAKILFETSLPTARKQVLAELDPWLPKRNPETASAM